MKHSSHSINVSAVGIYRFAVSSAIFAFAALHPGASLLHAAPIEWSIARGGNGHYYDKIDGSFTWEAANVAATASSFLGRLGHLVTVTSSAENLFLTTTYSANGLHLHWIGGVQPAGSSEPTGGWSWVTGGEPFVFNNWASGEPNNSTGANENRIVFDHGTTTSGKQWNDLAAGRAASGYIVEYDVTVPIFWYGDQATCDSSWAPHEGSFHHGNNWLNYVPPKASDQAAFYDELPDPLQSGGTIGASPYIIRFGDFNDDRPFGGCNSTFIQGGATSVGSVVVGSGSAWEFHFNSLGAPANSAPLNVLGKTTVAYDPHPNPLFYTVPYRIKPTQNPALHIHSGTMTSGSVTIGGTTGSPLLGSVGSGELKIASDAVLSSPSVTVARGGVLSGGGRVIGTVNVLNGGKVAPGMSVGSLTIQGDLRLRAGGELGLEVGGVVPGDSYDQLIVEGSVQLAGTVRIRFVKGFAPLVGDSFAFFGSNGFTANGATIVSDPGVQIEVQSNQALAVVAIPTPPAEYQSWRESKFGSSSSREGEPRANLDGDLSDNFTEFLFNLNPTLSDYHSLEIGAGSAGFPNIGIVQVSGERRLAFEFIRHKRFGQYLVQTSADLQTWTTEDPVFDSVVSVSNDYERVRALLPTPVSGTAQKYFRISVTY